MNIGELFLKMANGTPLSPLELSELRLWGNASQLNDEYVKSIQNGSGDINVNKIFGVSGEFRYSPSGLSSFVSFLYNSVPNNSATIANFTSSRFDELRGFSASTTFRIPFTGKYEITVHNKWSASAGGGYRQTKILNVGYGYMEEYDSQHSSENYELFNRIVGEVSLVGGSDISVELLQTSGGAINSLGGVQIRLIRNYDGDIV